MNTHVSNEEHWCKECATHTHAYEFVSCKDGIIEYACRVTGCDDFFIQYQDCP